MTNFGIDVSIQNFIEYIQKNDSILNSLESYNTLAICDSMNVSTVKINETLSRLCRKHYSVLAKIKEFKGQAKYEHRIYDSSIDTNILIWFKFSFEQQGNNVLVKNHSDGSSFLASSLSNAKQYIRENFK